MVIQYDFAFEQWCKGPLSQWWSYLIPYLAQWWSGNSVTISTCGRFSNTDRWQTHWSAIFFEDIIDESVFLPINITFLWNFPRCVNNEKHGLCTFSTSRDIFSKNLVVLKQKSDKLLQCWFKSAVKRLCSAIAMLSLGGNLFSALQCWIAVFRSKVQGRLKQFRVYIFYISAA